jgi:Na+-driven multidrug efflux pump
MSAPVLAKRRHDLRNAWVSLAFVPVCVVLADGILHAILSLLGIDEATDEDPNLLQALVAGVPYAAVMLLPALGGFWFGTSAIEHGDGRGRVPSVLSLVWAVLVLVGCAVFLFLVLRHGAGG